MSQELLLAAVTKIATQLNAIDLGEPEMARATLAARLPCDSPDVVAVRRLAEEGARDGWLLPKVAGGIRFGRVAKDVSGFSVDVVLSGGPGPRHRHPRGEIDLLFAVSGSPQFDGHPEGWAVYAPGSEHVPAVAGGEMLILYFLPGGEIDWIA